MRRRLVLLLAFSLPAVVACSDDDGGSLFDEAPPSAAEPTATITLEVAGWSWELPAAVCLKADGDLAAVLAAARQQAAEVRSLVGHLVSGWPTTSYALDFDYEAYERDLHAAGVTALALADLIGEQEALEAAWQDWEQGYGDPDEGWGPPNEVSGRLPQWRAEAEILTQAIADHCSAG